MNVKVGFYAVFIVCECMLSIFDFALVKLNKSKGAHIISSTCLDRSELIRVELVSISSQIMTGVAENIGYNRN